MGKADIWAGSSRPLSNWNFRQKEFDFARLIAANEYVITITRKSVQMSPQTVRIEAQAYSHPHLQEATNMQVSISAVIIVGYKGHPTIPDTDLERGDRFKYGDQLYTVLNFLPAIPYHIFAIADVTQTGK